MDELARQNAACRALALQAYRDRRAGGGPVLYAPQTKPNMGSMLASVSNSAKTWLASGMPVSESEVVQVRLKTCQSCEWWDSKAFKGTGKCLKCGCSTWAKLRMATERCPLGKWGSAAPENDLPETQQTTKKETK